MPDHVHLLVGLHPSIAISDLVHDIKISSTNYINERKSTRGKFNWQKGFGAFSYSRSHIRAVATYIRNQEDHHKKRNFRDEYIKMLDDFKIEYNHEYLFDWITGNEK